MFRQKMIMPAVCFVLCGGIPARAAEEKPASNAVDEADGALPVLRIAQSPKIDGRLDDVCWQNAAQASGFMDIKRANCPFPRKTIVRTAYDARTLYLAAECFEPNMTNILASVTFRDGSVFNDDCLEIFLDVKRDRATYYQLAFNALGACWDGAKSSSGQMDQGWDSGVVASAQRLPDRWVLEAAIPFESLKVAPPKEGTIWGFNAAREHRVGAAELALSSWSLLTSGGFGNPREFSPLIFVGETIPPSQREITRMRPTIRNADFTSSQSDGSPIGWKLGAHTKIKETAYLSGVYEIWTDADQLMARQDANFRCVGGRELEVTATARGENDGRLGVTLVYETRAGAEERLRAFWDQSLTNALSRHSIAVTLPKTAERITGVEIYRSNERGLVAVSSVSLADVLTRYDGIKETAETFPEHRRPVGKPFVSECVPWAQPLAGGPLRVLIIQQGNAREAVELAQRVEMNYDVCCVDNEVLLAYGAREINARLRREQPPYDVILLAASVRDTSFLQVIKQNVRKGTGLVFIQRDGDKEAALNLADVLPKTSELAVAEPARAQGVPWRYFPVIADNYVFTGARGEPAVKRMGAGESRPGCGRVVELDYGGPVPTRGILPRTANNPSDLAAWWEYAYSLLGKSILYAANRPAPATITSLAANLEKGRLTIGLTVTNELRNWNLSVDWADRYGVTNITVTESSITAGPGKKSIEIPIPPILCRLQGVHLANIRLKDSEGRVADWATAAFTVAGGLQIVERRPFERDWFRNGEAIAGKITIENRSNVTAELTLDVALVDAMERVVWTTSRPLSLNAGMQSTVDVAPTLERVVTVYHRLRAILRDAAGPRAAREWELYLPDQWAYVWDDYRAGVHAGYFHRVQPDGPITKWFKENGLTYVTEGGTFESAPRFNMPWQKDSVVWEPFKYHKGGPVREPCLSDPAVLRAATTLALGAVRQNQKYAPLFYNIGDELELARDGRMEVCFCPRCAAAFRTWAKDRYATLNRVNAEWGTTFSNWEEVMPITARDARARGQFAQWVDFRVFMEDTWVRAFRTIKDAVQKEFPDTRWSFTNPFKLNPFSGSDHYKLAQAEDVFLKYVRPDLIKEYHSFKPDAPMNTYFGYLDGIPACRYFPWWFTFNGGDMNVWYLGMNYSDAIAIFDDLGRHTPRSRAGLESTAGLLTGIGKIIHEFPDAPKPVAMLHSHNSMHVSWIESNMRLGECPWADAEFVNLLPPPPNQFKLHNMSIRNLKAMVKETAQQPDMIVPDQILAGRLAFPKYRLLILPCSVALSDDVIARIADFVRSGGTVLADFRAGLYGENGRRIASRPALEEIFGFRRAGNAYVSNNVALTSWSGSFTNLQGLGQAAEGVGRETIALTTARTCARHADGAPAILVNAYGRGNAIYLNFTPGRGPLYNALMQNILDIAGIESDVRLTAGERAAFGYECFYFQRGRIEYAGILRDMTPLSSGERVGWFGAEFCNAVAGPEKITVHLPAARHVYDVRDGKYLGYIQTIPNEMAPAEAGFFGLLPYRVKDIAISMKPEYRPGEMLRYQADVKVSEGNPGDRFNKWLSLFFNRPVSKDVPGDHVLRIEIFDPAGKLVSHYTKNVLAQNGSYQENLSLALNEKPGEWSLKVMDVTSKISRTKKFMVAQAQDK